MVGGSIFYQRGKKDIPLWVLSMVPHKYIYNTLDEVITTIKAIDEGIIRMNSDKWRLLQEDLR